MAKTTGYQDHLGCQIKLSNSRKSLARLSKLKQDFSVILISVEQCPCCKLNIFTEVGVFKITHGAGQPKILFDQQTWTFSLTLTLTVM